MIQNVCFSFKKNIRSTYYTLNCHNFAYKIFLCLATYLSFVPSSALGWWPGGFPKHRRGVSVASEWMSFG